ncbi:MAG TPA: DUF3037 domain-containing protein [Chloroflexota bacterium]|nr:DUF3037 domain-containing protein [Chloroflexota bacterium]
MWYSYATIRVVPRVEREEFINVGVILFAREQRSVAARVELDRARLANLAPELDVELVERHLRTFLEISDGNPSGGPVAALPAPERFHWLVAPRSTMIQTSAVHVGRGDDLEQALNELLDDLVRRPADRQDSGDSEVAANSDGA